MTVDADLRLIVDAWPALPEPIRVGILAMVKAAKPDSGSALSVPAKSNTIPEHERKAMQRQLEAICVDELAKTYRPNLGASRRWA